MNIQVEGQNVALVGDPVDVGYEMPHFKLLNKDNEKVKTADLLGKLTLISVVPDIDTPVCSIQTRNFNKLMAENPDVNFVTVSTNTVDQQTKWCAAEGIEMTMLSDSQESFGYEMRLYIPTMGVDARAIYIMDADGVIKYRQIVDELTHEPDYDAAIEALKNL